MFLHIATYVSFPFIMIISALQIDSFIHMFSFEQKKRTKLSAGNYVGMGGSAMSSWKKRRNAMILWCPEACNLTTSGTLPVSFLRRYSSTRPASAGSSAHSPPVTARPPLSGGSGVPIHIYCVHGQSTDSIPRVPGSSAAGCLIPARHANTIFSKQPVLVPTVTLVSATASHHAGAVIWLMSLPKNCGSSPA